MPVSLALRDRPASDPLSREYLSSTGCGLNPIAIRHELFQGDRNREDACDCFYSSEGEFLVCVNLAKIKLELF